MSRRSLIFEVKHLGRPISPSSLSGLLVALGGAGTSCSCHVFEGFVRFIQQRFALLALGKRGACTELCCAGLLHVGLANRGGLSVARTASRLDRRPCHVVINPLC